MCVYLFIAKKFATTTRIQSKACTRFAHGCLMCFPRRSSLMKIVEYLDYQYPGLRITKSVILGDRPSFVKWYKTGVSDM